MKIKMRHNKLNKKWFSIIFLLVALFLFTSAIMDIVKATQYTNYSNANEENYVTIQATISNITSQEGTHNSSHDVYVTYTYQGETYENIPLNMYSSSMYIGKTIDILCNTEHPDTIKAENTLQFYQIVTIIFASVKILMAILIVICALHILKKASSKAKPLLKHKLKRANTDLLKIVRIFIIISLIFIIVGILLLIKGIDFYENADKINAEIVDIQEWRDSDGDWHERVYVTYEYCEKEYGYVPLSSSTNKEVGDTITIYVNPNNPIDVSTSNMPYLGIILIIIGIGFMLITTPIIIRVAKENYKRNQLLANGATLQATVSSITIDPSLKVNGRRPYMLICCYEDVFSGKRYVFHSEGVWNDLNHYFKPGDLIDVHVLPNDYEQYYIDLERNMAARVLNG